MVGDGWCMFIARPIQPDLKLRKCLMVCLCLPTNYIFHVRNPIYLLNLPDFSTRLSAGLSLPLLYLSTSRFCHIYPEYSLSNLIATCLPVCLPCSLLHSWLQCFLQTPSANEWLEEQPIVFLRKTRDIKHRTVLRPSHLPQQSTPGEVWRRYKIYQRGTCLDEYLLHKKSGISSAACQWSQRSNGINISGGCCHPLNHIEYAAIVTKHSVEFPVYHHKYYPVLMGFLPLVLPWRYAMSKNS